MKTNNISSELPLIKSKTTVPRFLIAVALVSFGLLPAAQAVVPAPDGGYPGGNTAEGQNALFSLTSGGYNTALGFFSLRSITDGSFNTAIGAGALFLNTADQSTAIGTAALLSNTTGYDNTANGAFALSNNTTGNDNTANGANALFSNTTGYENTADGSYALQHNTTGSTNTALGYGAGSNVTTASNVICIGSGGGNVSGSCFIDNIRGVTTSSNDAIPVVIDFFGQLGTASSSRRFKKEIIPMDKASEAVLALKPVTFHYKSDETNRPEFGLIAEDVAEVNPDLVVRDDNGEIYTVRYDAVNAMLLNEFLKAHKRMQDLEARDAQQQKQIEALTKQLREQAAHIEKVNAQHELGESARQVATNNS
jgi:hypothetical protein